MRVVIKCEELPPRRALRTKPRRLKASQRHDLFRELHSLRVFESWWREFTTAEAQLGTDSTKLIFVHYHRIIISTMRRKLTINFGRSILPKIRPGLLARLPRSIRKLSRGGRIFIITDSNVLRLHGRAFHRALSLEGLDATVLEISPGEGSKSVRTLSALQTQLLTHGADRKSLVVLLGGGVVGDVGGFAAATVLRGIPYVQVPTTLLAQVDSSIGGKVGINHALGKNLVGAFAQPLAVFADPAVLQTLPLREIRNGLAEVVKIAFACDSGFFRWLERHSRTLGKPDPSILTFIVRKSATLKTSIVKRDLKDEGIRKILNFGHTVGHALEASSGYRLPHGMAVSVGMLREARVAVSLGLLKQGDYDRLRQLLHACRLPVENPRSFNRSAFERALGFDKKMVREKMILPLPVRVGRMRSSVEVTRELLLG